MSLLKELSETTRMMNGDANIAAVASLLADPARASIVVALSDGRSLPAGELARLAHVAPSTASSHLARLVEGGLLKVETCGKNRYFHISGPEVVGAIEALALLAPYHTVRSFRQAREAEAIHFARTCYDHLAGFLGVEFTKGLVNRRILIELEDGYRVTEEGLADLREFGVDLSGRRGEIRFVPRHVDWSERYHHFAGPLAKAVTDRLFELEWILRIPSGRAVRLTEKGREGLQERFGLTLKKNRDS